MTEQHPMTPPPELVQQWASEWMQLQNVNRDNFMAIRAAQYGADQELEACCEWVKGRDWTWTPANLRAARRPKPPSLKQQVLATLQHPKDLWSADEVDAIRRLVEQLDE